jgi:hypothetical protein
MQKESVQSDHPALRKRPTCGRILQIWAIGKISQYLSTFWTFSIGRVVELS